LEPQQALVGKKDPGSKPGPICLNMVFSGVLESQPTNVHSGEGVIRNFIWCGKDAPAHAKVKWDMLVLPTSQGGLGIIDPKSQLEALLAKLLVRGLARDGEPWKELIRHKADQIKLPVHQLAFRRS